MKNEKIIAEKLLQAEAVKLNPQQPFTWASGWKSPIYCDNRKVLSFPYLRDFIKSELCNAVFETYPEADVIAGVATAGIAWGAMTADQLKLPFVYVRPKPKDHGLQNQVEGFFSAGQKAVVIEDLVSTGKSSLHVVEILRSAGVGIMGMVTIFNYGFSVAEEAFKSADVELESLTTYNSLINLAIEKNIVSPEDEKLLKSWRAHPDTWNVTTEI